MKALVGAFNQEKALVGAFSVIVKTDCETDGSFTELIRTDKIAFFINIYNALVIHAHVERGVPTSTYQRYKFFSGMSYNIGGYNLSLNDIENGVLRSNRAAMATLYMKPFSASDPRMKIILPEVEPRIHFALNCGAKSCPPIKTFSGNEGTFIERNSLNWFGVFV